MHRSSFFNEGWGWWPLGIGDRYCISIEFQYDGCIPIHENPTLKATGLHRKTPFAATERLSEE